MGEVSPQDRVEVQLLKLEAAWEKRRFAKKNKNALFWSVLYAFKREYNVAVFWNIVVTVFQLCSPFILQRLIVFI